MLINTDEHFKQLDKLLDRKPKAAYVSTFNVWASIMHDGRDLTKYKEKYANKAYDFLERLNNEVKKVKLLIGTSEYASCAKEDRCISCEKKFVKVALRNIECANKWSNCDWRFVVENHFKCYMFFYDDTAEAVVGGRNLNNSKWTDISLLASKKQIPILYKLFNKTWSRGVKIDDANVSKFLVEQEIEINPDWEL